MYSAPSAERALHTFAKTPMHAVATMQMTARAFCKKRDGAGRDAGGEGWGC